MCDEHYNSIRASRESLRMEVRIDADESRRVEKTKRGYLFNNVPQHDNCMQK